MDRRNRLTARGGSNLPTQNREPDPAGACAVPATVELCPREINMTAFTIKNDNGPDIKISGEMIGYAATSENNAHTKFSGSPGRWTELMLYRTVGGKHVAANIEHSNWQGERNMHSAVICENHDQIVEFFGYGPLASDLYADAGIDPSQAVD
jgi:hypothetical protein